MYFYHPDHLGTATFLTDINGLPYEFFLNLPFGETMAEQHSQTEDYINRWKFTGHELDKETGLYYAGARYYDPKVSFWLSVDPLAEKYPSWNPYNYTLQNPINYIDPDGKNPIVGAVIGGGLEVLLQLANIYIFETSTSIDWVEVGISAGAGFIGVGVLDKLKKVEKITGIGGDELIDIAGDLTKIYRSSGKVGLQDIAEVIISNSKAGDIGKVLNKLGLGKYFFKSFDDILGNSKLLRETTTGLKIYEKRNKNYNDALRDFERMDLDDVKDLYDKEMKVFGKMGKDSDGNIIKVRNKSSDGRPTIEKSTPTGRKKVEIRYGTDDK